MTVVDLRVFGQAELKKVAGLLREADRRDLERELRASQRRAFSGLEKSVKKSALEFLPHRGGYASTMFATVRVEIVTRLSGRVTVRARVFARGSKELRDVASVNRGRLRHPLFGNRLHWYDTRVKPGFVDSAASRVPDAAVREGIRGVERVIRKITKG